MPFGQLGQKGEAAGGVLLYYGLYYGAVRQPRASRIRQPERRHMCLCEPQAQNVANSLPEFPLLAERGLGTEKFQSEACVAMTSDWNLSFLGFAGQQY